MGLDCASRPSCKRRSDCEPRGARIAAVSRYGMVEYRYGLCANAVELEGTR